MFSTWQIFQEQMLEIHYEKWKQLTKNNTLQQFHTEFYTMINAQSSNNRPPQLTCKLINFRSNVTTLDNRLMQPTNYIVLVYSS